ncbi:MAG TPA: hypothetical protein VJR92_15010 [Gemmatimonadaceae bacterium]|nr:hypothetical protein [Gemmatimonadaceae bacterium]
MPRIASLARKWILERLELQARFGKSNATPILEQQFTIAGDQVRHRSAVPDVSMHPQTAGHRVDHAIAPPRELTPRRGRHVS